MAQDLATRRPDGAPPGSGALPSSPWDSPPSSRETTWARCAAPARSAADREASPCAKGACRRRASEREDGALLCREHAEVARARRWQKERARWVLACDAKLREALASREEEQQARKKWEGLLEEAGARLAWAKADLAAAEAKA